MRQKLAVLLLLMLCLDFCQASGATREEITAQHFALLVTATENTLLPQAQKAGTFSDGETWLDGCPDCLTPLAQSVCDVPLSLLKDTSPFLRFDDQRFHIHIQHGLCYIYGTVDRKEMAAIRQKLRGSLALSFCPSGASDGFYCLPKLLTDDGSALSLPMFELSHKDSVVHVFKLAH